jgi:hypothetical protein
MIHQELIRDYKNSFIRDYGRVKYDNLYEKVRNSKHLNRGIRISRSKNLPMLAGDFLTIGATHAGLFSKKSTKIMGALLTFEFWNEELNSSYELASPEDLIIEIQKCLRGY